MKMKLLALLLIVTTTVFGQLSNGNNGNHTPDLIITQHFALNGDFNLPEDHEGNCGGGNGNEVIYLNAGLNLNGHTLTLKGVTLIITGNVTGWGNIVDACNNGASVLIINGTTYDLPYNGTLTTAEFNPFKDFGLPYKAYDLRGALIKEGTTSENLFFDLPKSQVLLIQVKGFKPYKISLK